ncbi:MAG TPA: NHL repeat-containing protein, partial [Solirubrobacterales bacterium]|nr:NHL repeat-containing protein [Solirubrobacterales bacterium]
MQPDPAATAEQIESVEREETAKEEWLKSPEAIRQREESLTAFDDLSAADAQNLVGAAFPELLERLDGDPARALSDMQIEEVVDVNAALVPDPEGGSQLVELPIPIRSEVPGEDQKPIDLTLKESAGGFVSEVPATDILLPSSAGGEVEVGDGLGVTSLSGNPEVSATRFGDKDLFFANTDTDTDTFIAPLAKGVEVFQQLRSPKSPEQFRFALTLPKGSTLRPDGRGGAEIIDPAEQRVGFIPAPYAVDAQGTGVPVSMTVDGDAVVLDVPHRSLDIAYPVLLDPELVKEHWYWPGDQTFGLGYWVWQENADYENSTGCIVSCWASTGLYLRSRGSEYSYGPYTWGRWVYTAPNITAYISRAELWDLRGDVNNCPTYQPHGYVGLWNGAGVYQGLGVYSPLSFNAPSFDTGWTGYTATRELHVGIGTAGATSKLACGHDFYVAGATIYQDDPENPTVSVSGMPGGWISDGKEFTITANGYDPGLGIRKTTFTRDGSPNSSERSVGCNGTAASRCPVNRTEHFNISALSFDEGKNNAYMTVEDATGRKTSPPYTWQTYVDMTKPDLELKDQLAVATEDDKGGTQGDEKVEELSLPVYNLDIKATDVGPESDANKKKRSGVRKVEVLLDEVKKQTWEQSCADSCAMEKMYSLKLNNLGAGEHVLKVIATDGVGKQRERTIEFEYIPATGMKDEYVMQYFPLPDGSEGEDEEENPSRPELAVNAINGNLVYREKDVDVEGYSVDLEVERYYNSLLPEAENTEWGDGWTLAQTPDLQPEAGPGPPEQAMMVRPSGAVEGAIELPGAVNEGVFDPELQAVVTREADGGYEVADATGESGTALAFNQEGRTEELRTEGLAKIDYSYEGSVLDEIAVDDPASAGGTPEEALEREAIEDITPVFKSATGTQGSGDGQFKVARDVAIDPTDGTHWVVDDENDRIQHFSASGGYLGKFSSCYDPASVLLDSQGDIYVACNGGLKKYSDAGALLETIATRGEGEAQVRFVTDMALDSEEELWVASQEGGEVKHFDAEGDFVDSFSTGSVLERPWGIAVSGSGEIYVTQPYYRHRVAVFDQEGELLRTFGSQGSGEGQFEFPSDVEIEHGDVWVADARNDRVQVFNEAGEYVTEFGSPGTGPGQLDSDWWLRLDVDAKGNVLLTDQANHRVQRW